MKVTNIAAARVVQGDLCLYTTSLTVRDLIQEGSYQIDRLEPKDHQVGYQRLLQESRAKRLADYIIDGHAQERQDAFLPTSVFLATAKNIDFNDKNNTISFDTDEIGAFSVVDGQHRLEGLRIAAGKISAERREEVLKFQIPVNIAYNMSDIEQMCHFYIVNTTQKSVDRAIGQQIISRLTKIIDIENTPTLPEWIRKIVAKGGIEKSLELVKYLNKTRGSPWQGKIQMANEPKTKKMTAKQGSFVSVIDTYVKTAGHPLRVIGDKDRERRIFLNYWRAVANLLEPKDAAETVLYKYGGLLLFSMFSIPFFHKMNAINDGYEVEKMQQVLANCFNNMDGEYEILGTPEGWLSKTGHAGGINAGVASRISISLTQALNKS